MYKKAFDGVNHEKLEKLIEIKSSYLLGKITKEEARKEVLENYRSITPEEFAYTEQVLKDLGFEDDTVHAKMDELLTLLDGVMEKAELDLPLGHPIQTYREENTAVKNLLGKMDTLMLQEFDKEQWQNFYEKLSQFNIHLSRKQNQLFSKLEQKGFDRPSKIMWSFDNEVKKSISNARSLLEKDEREEFLALQPHVREVVLDIIDKEESVLFPTSVKLISPEEFAQMRKGDDEIGYCLIDNPPNFEQDEPVNTSLSGDFAKELHQLLEKYQVASSDVLDVKQGKLTLEQINLIFQHLPIDLSYVDENELVKFYSDTTHRVFPRSPGVIGRDVKNCHPRESLDTVNEIIESFRKGKKSKAEFWLEIGGKFIYILYIAIRNDKGEFKGVLEMMQDATHIRELQGSRRLLSWDDEPQEEGEKMENPFGFTKDTLLYDIIQKHPYIREFMPTLSPKYEKLLNPIAFNSIGKIATLEMVSMRGNMELNELIAKISKKIETKEKE